MSAYPSLETARLLLLPVELADASAIQRIFPIWKIVRFLDDKVPWPYPDDGAETFLRHVLLPNIAAGTEFCWSIRRKAAPGQLIGLINLRLGESDNRGFWLDPAYQGQGLTGEAADAVTDFWFGVLGQRVLRVPKAIDNIASRRISLRQPCAASRHWRKIMSAGECFRKFGK